jgi:uncharacterized protein (DUF3084 family)
MFARDTYLNNHLKTHGVGRDEQHEKKRKAVSQPAVNEQVQKYERQLAFLRLRLSYLKQEREEMKDALVYYEHRRKRIRQETNFLLDELMLHNRQED